MKIGIWFVVFINFIYVNDVKYVCDSVIIKGNLKLNIILNFSFFVIFFCVNLSFFKIL